MEYVLNNKDRPVCVFNISGSVVTDLVISKINLDYLPLPVKRIIHNPEEFILENTEEFIIVNEDGCFLFEYWLENREIPVNRENYSKYIQKGIRPMEWMLNNHAISFTDNYWIKEAAESIDYEDILLCKNEVEEYFTICNRKMYSGLNATLGGQLEKFWYKSDNVLKMCKRTSVANAILSVRELIASQIYESLQTIDYCEYRLVFDTKGRVVGSKCACFTSEQLELITAYDLLEEYNLTQQDNVYELIIDLAFDYGLDREITRKYMDNQTIVDFLILNRDRHQSNIGFLRDSNTLKIVRPAPVYDSGSCSMLEEEQSESIADTKLNALYHTERELVSHVKTLGNFRFDHLIGADVYFQLLVTNGVNEERAKALVQLFEDKQKYLKNQLDLQRQI